MYVNGYILAVPEEKKEAYVAAAKIVAVRSREQVSYGAKSSRPHRTSGKLTALVDCNIHL